MVKEKSGTSSKGERSQNIQVAVRCRPTSQYEMKLSSPNAVEIDPKSRDITVRQDISYLDKGNQKTFQFDKVFGPKSKQIDVYKQMVQPVVEEVLQGYNCTIFAYGQTGTGKTFTMEGERSSEGSFSWQDDPLSGIIPRALHQLFTRLNASEECAEFSVMVSFLEIYNEELFDLLGTGMDNQKLRLFEDTTKKGAIRVHGLEEVTVHSRNEVYEILERGTQRRQTAATLLNAHSSRSHSLFTVTIHMKENNINGEEFLKTGKLNLVDLAGSENIGRSGAVEKRAREAGTINTSLLTLGRVITSLVENTPHVPYRESKLTRLLKDSLGGHTKTSIIATISPAACNLEETLSTLDYASRAKCIKNKPEVNQKLTKKALIKEYTEQIEKLKKDLYAAREKNGIFLSEENFQEMQNQLQAQKGNLKEFVERIEALEEEKRKTEKLFSSTQKQLEDTAKKLNWTKQVVSEKSEIIEHHRETEDELYEKGKNLLETVQETVNDNTSLHQSLMRKKQVQEANLTASQRFKDTALSQLKDLNVKMKEQEDLVRTFQDNFKCRLNMFSVEKDAAKDKLLEDIKASKDMMAEKVDHLLSDQLVWKESQKHESAKFREEFIKLKSQCLDTVRSLMEMQNSAMEKMQSYVKAVNNDCNALEKTISSASEKFSSASQEVAAKHHGNVKALSDTIHTYVTAEKNIFDDVRNNTNKILTNQEQIHQQIGEELKSELIAHFHELFQAKIQRAQKGLQNDTSLVTSNVDTQGKNREQFLRTVDSQVCSINETIKNESDEMIQSRKTVSVTLSNGIEKMKAQAVGVNTEILELESCEAAVESKFKDGIEKHHKCGMEYNEHMWATCSKHASSIDTRLEKLMSSNKEDFDRIGKKLDDESSKTSNFFSVMIDEKDEEIGLCVEQCKQSDAKVDLLQNTLVGFVEEEIVADNPTGCTPKPKKYTYPDRLRRTQDHAEIVESFRQKTGALPVPFLKPDGEFECEGGGTEEDQDSESDASSKLNTSGCSRSTIPSTGTEGDDPAEDESEENTGAEDDLSPYPTPQIRKTKQTNRCDGKENVGLSNTSSAVKNPPPSATKIPRTPLSSSNF